MSEQLGWRGLVKNLKNESPEWASLLPQIPRLMHAYLARNEAAQFERWHRDWLQQQKHQSRMIYVLLFIVALLLIAQLWTWTR